MGKQIIECVPNVSEGRRPEVIEEIVSVVKATSGVTLLDCSSDADHNRSVITFIGDSEGVKEAAYRLIEKTVALINMEKHQGGHPRIGACDVMPFVPIRGVTIAECVALAKELGAKVASGLNLPVYLYGEAATISERRNLANIRQGQYEGLKEAIQEPGRAPDFGPARLHPTAGAIVIGARMALIAFNVNLGTPDINIAKKIARVIREGGGGLKNVMAIGVMLEEKNITQVSMNMVNYVQTPLYRSYEMVKMEAQRYGVPVVGSEIVGITPVDALIDVAEYYLQLEGFSGEQILENRLYE
ncbi:MAG TPA: glutamate formimidoyltransferase [Dehalococcoidia bacterium]|nr:glutamate formimidoyltransferase [Dehalococcoidia bacterium]